jgi:DNA processing protein
VSTPHTTFIAFNDDAYPPMLREIPDPPPRIYVMGRIELLHAPCLAIVGARNATPQGRRNARAFARDLSDAGLCIVSGLALGIDAAAHAGGLEGAASSIAVMGTGADIVYPTDNAALAERLKQAGCVITEYPPGTPPRPGNFPRRNRLISGLSKGVLVIEASRRSGSLITARMAAHQNREAFALPGSIHSPMSRGCHELIREGAKLVECTEDVLVELGLQDIRECEVAEERLTADTLLAAIGRDCLSFDQIVELTGLAASACAARLSLLEIDGRIDALPGGRFQRAQEE